MLKLLVKHSEPFVSAEELKENLRVLHNNEDLLIKRLAETACQYIEEASGRKLNDDQMAYILPSIICESIALPFSPVSSVDAFNYYDVDNILQSIDVGTLQVFISEDSSYLLPADGDVWPTTYARNDAVSITFTTGYPDEVAFPENLRQAAILLASHWYENRTAADMQMQEIPFGVQPLINLSRVNWYV